MINYTACPLCGSDNIRFALTAKDHTVSSNAFPIWHCKACTARFTQDVPPEEEIAVYYASEDYISHSDTKKGLINRLYHLVRQRTLSSKRRLVINRTRMRKGAILDIGCGTGAFLHNMQEAGWTVTGIEPDAAARHKAGELYGIQPLEPSKLFEQQPGSYHAITMWHVLEHVHNLHGYLQKISELLAPGGKLFIAVPNYTSYDARVYKGNWAAWDVPRHLYHFSPKSMELLLQQYNLKLLACKPMWYDSFYVGMLSEKYRTGKGNLIRACWNGFISNGKALFNKQSCSSVIYIIAPIP